MTEADRLASEVGRRHLARRTEPGNVRDRAAARCARSAAPQPIMELATPHYLLYSEASVGACRAPRWQFVLRSVDGSDCLAADDTEPESRASRLELLAVVRGLEALDQPSRVTLLTRSRYVQRGIRRELSQWRERRWRWERFGKLVPIQDHDLWQRIDRALEFHRVECCAWPAIAPHAGAALGAAAHSSRQPIRLVIPRRARRLHRWPLPDGLTRLRHHVAGLFSAIWRAPFTRAA